MNLYSFARTGPRQDVFKVLVVLMFGFTLTLSACTTGSSPASSDISTITIGQDEDIETMDPAMHRSRSTQYVIHQVMDPLVDIGPDFEPQPNLAVEWDQTAPNIWTFKLRHGVEFTNGEPFNADAVVFTFERILDPETASPRASLLPTLDRVKAVDDFTVEFHTTTEDAYLAKRLATHEIVPVGYMKKVGMEEFAKHPIGTGPFKFVAWVPGQRVVLEANQEYWAGAPKAEKLIFKPIPETASRVAALKAGEVDIINKVPHDIAQTLTGAVTTMTVPGTRIYFLAMNVKMEPFANKSIRQAVEQAVDQESLASTIYGGLADPLNQPAFEGMDCFEHDYAGYAFDASDAARVLRGLPRITIDVSEASKTLAEAVAGQLRNVGLEVSVNSMEDGAFTSKINAGGSSMYLSDWGFAKADCDTVYRTHFHSETRELQQFTGYSSPQTDRLIDSAYEALPDVEKALPYYRELMHTVMDDAPWVPLISPEEVYGVSKSLHGWEPSSIGRYDLLNTEVDR